MSSRFLLVLIPLFLLSSCDMEKEVDLKIPEYQSQLVVECYLDPGKPYQLLLQESMGYLDFPRFALVDSAQVTITHNNVTYTLKPGRFTDKVYGKTYNYSSDSSIVVPADYNSEFSLRVADKKGRVATAKTVILQPVKIAKLEIRYSKTNTDEASPYIEFEDDLSIKNYYRYFVTEIDPQPNTLSQYSSKIDYTIDDELSQKSTFGLGGPYRLDKGQQAFVYLFHVTKEYYDYLRSVDDAKSANGNPFGQPASVKSNVTGGIGIFTGLSYDYKDIVP